MRTHCTSRSTDGAPDCPRLVVIGNGMVGVRLLEDLLARAPDRHAITVLGAEPVPAYNRIALSEVLSGRRDAGEIALQPAAWYARHGIDLRVGVPVTAIDRAAWLISTADGSAVPYDVLVIATGSRPFVPPLPGHEKEGVFVFRTLDDCAAITSYAQRCRTATVLGGGLLGLEAARGLLSHGLAVTVVEAAPHLMCQQLDAESGAILRQVMEGLGLRVVTAATTAAVLGNGRVTGLALHEGDDLDADMVVVSCGIRPNVDLARQAGLTVERGIVVDDHLRTDDPAIFAAGECAQHRGTVYGLVAPLYEQTRVLASVLANDTAACYTGSRPTTTLKVMGVELVSLGRLSDASPGDEIVTYSEPAGESIRSWSCATASSWPAVCSARQPPHHLCCACTTRASRRLRDGPICSSGRPMRWHPTFRRAPTTRPSASVTRSARGRSPSRLGAARRRFAPCLPAPRRGRGAAGAGRCCKT